MALHGSLGRDDLSAYLGELFDFRFEREPGNFWDQALALCTVLHLVEHEERIRKAYAEFFADSSLVLLEDALERLHAEVLDDFDLREFQPLGEAVDEIEYWHCFTLDAEREEMEEAWRENDPDLEDPETDDDGVAGYEAAAREAGLLPQARRLPTAPARKVPTPGRNDPCPCGSGRKFKRCCGR